MEDDIDLTNKQRAERVVPMLKDRYVRDVLADLMHLCAQQEIDFADELDLARKHFAAEVEEEE
jgi:hypothetical protein